MVIILIGIIIGGNWSKARATNSEEQLERGLEKGVGETRE